MESALKINGKYESIIFNNDIIQTQGSSKITLQARLDNNTFANYQAIPAQNCITKIDLPNNVDLKLISKTPFSYTAGIVPTYYDKQKIEDYLYEITYGNLDYDYAYQNLKPSIFGGCSAIRNGNLFGRNFDWLYNQEVQFIVHTPSSINYLGTIGVAGIIPGIDKDTVDQDDIIIEEVDMFKLLPFYLLDGINEKKVFCTHNIVPLDSQDSPTREVVAKIEEKERVNIMMLTRFVLDRFVTAEQAVNYIKNYVTLTFFNEMIDAGYQSHFMIGDENNTYVLEFINGEIKVYEQNYITNFPITGVVFNSDNHIQYPPTQFGMNKYGSGLERWSIIVDNYSITNTIQGMRNLLELIKYSNCYSSNNFWYSEIVKMTSDTGSKITVDTDPNKCTNAKQNVLYLYRIKDRNNPKVWITCHSCVYDIKHKTLNIKNQENEIEYIFNLI